MPIVPNLAMPGSPAMPNAPAMERGGGVRVNANDALRGLGRVADSLAGMTPVPGVPDDLGQGRARGLMAIGQGVRDLGQARMEIEAEIAKARNYNLLSEASLAMEKEIGEFEKFKLSNPDPATWPAEWDRRLSEWPGRYLEGRDYPPAVKDAINSRIIAKGQSYGIEVGIAAKKQEVATARANMKFEFSRAGSIEEVEALAATPEAKLWMHPVELEMTRLEAKDRLEAEQLDILRNVRDTAILNGNEQAALDAVDQMPIRDDEKALERASVSQRSGYQIALREVEDILDPLERVRRLESGEFDRLRPSDRQALLDGAYQEINIERSGVVKSLGERIKMGDSLRDIEMTDAFRSLPDASKIALSQLAAEGAKNDVSEYLTALRAAQSYDPAKDPRGEELAALQEAAALSFTGERSDAILSTLADSAARTEPQSALEKVEADYFTYLQSQYDDGKFGNFRVTGADISPRKDENGVTIYTVPDPEGKEFPGLLGTYRGRVIQLSEKDRLRYESGKKGDDDLYEDLSTKEAAFSKFQSVQEELVKRRQEGLITNADDMAAAGASLLGGELREAASTRLESNGIEFPRHSWGRSGNQLLPAAIDERAEALLRKVDELNKQGQ